MSWSPEENRTDAACEFQQNLDILREVRFFAGLSPEALKLLAYLCTRETFKPGERLFTQGEDDGQAFFLVSGQARLLRETNGREQEMRVFEAGAFLGGITLLGGMRRLFSLVAVTDVVCLVLTREKFSRVLEQFPDMMPKVLKGLVESISAWEERFMSDAFLGADSCQKKSGVSLI
jgi:CRP-like cAMP-binding protein